MPPACAVVTQVGGILRYWPGKHRSDKAFHDLGTRFDADDPAVQRDMIVGGAVLWSKVKEQKIPHRPADPCYNQSKRACAGSGTPQKWRT